MQQGIIFDIKKYAIHDGPGIRTTVFFKGCPLDCRWCHNPEGLKSSIEGLFRQDRCIGCSACLRVCPQKAIVATAFGLRTDWSRCEHCGACVQICPAGARELVGKKISVAEVMREVEKDILFYDQSGGGVTFSGGEPLMQPEFLLGLLEACGRLGLHRAVDTTGWAESQLLLEVAQKTDLFLYDLKQMDDDKHREYTGLSNARILGNLKLLARQGAKINIRLPVIPGINDDAGNIRALKDFVEGLPGVRDINLLPYHRAAREKYRRLGISYRLDQLLPPPKEVLEKIKKELEAPGFRVTIGG
jgi:pyruvate formate lyase activating enzyme